MRNGGGRRKSNLGQPARRSSPPVNGVNGIAEYCANCKVTVTPLWRKDKASGARGSLLLPLAWRQRPKIMRRLKRTLPMCVPRYMTVPCMLRQRT